MSRFLWRRLLKNQLQSCGEGSTSGGRTDDVAHHLVLAHPNWAVAQGEVIWRYLKGAGDPIFLKEKGEGWAGGPRALEVCADSSFAGLFGT